jgi:hypothetical protein
MATMSPRRFVIVAAPSATAGIGDALRRAFQRPDTQRMNETLERLIKRLDQY